MRGKPTWIPKQHSKWPLGGHLPHYGQGPDLSSYNLIPCQLVIVLNLITIRVHCVIDHWVPFKPLMVFVWGHSLTYMMLLMSTMALYMYYVVIHVDLVEGTDLQCCMHVPPTLYMIGTHTLYIYGWPYGLLVGIINCNYANMNHMNKRNEGS